MDVQTADNYPCPRVISLGDYIHLPREVRWWKQDRLRQSFAHVAGEPARAEGGSYSFSSSSFCTRMYRNVRAAISYSKQYLHLVVNWWARAFVALRSDDRLVCVNSDLSWLRKQYGVDRQAGLDLAVASRRYLSDIAGSFSLNALCSTLLQRALPKEQGVRMSAWQLALTPQQARTHDSIPHAKWSTEGYYCAVYLLSAPNPK